MRTNVVNKRPGSVPGFFVPTICLVLALGLFFVSPARADSARDILVQSVGGPDAIAQIRGHQTSYSIGTIKLNEQDGKFRQYYKAPDKFRLEVDFGQFSLTQGYNGHDAWQIDLTGSVSPLQGFERDELLKNIYFESARYLTDGQNERTYELVGTETIEGDRLHRFNFFPNGVDTITVYFRESDSMRVQTVDHLDNLKIVTETSDFRKVGGVLIPFRSVATVAAANLKTEMLVDSTAYNIDLNDSLFDPPGTVSSDVGFPPGADSVRFPFDYFGGHIRVQANVNGKRLWFILDTGASATMLNRASVIDLGLPVIGSLPTRGVADFADVDLVQIDSINIDAVTMHNIKGGVLDLAAMDRKSPLGGKFGGMIGYDFFSRFPVMIDYRWEMITVYHPDRFHPPDNTTSIPFELTMQVPAIEASIGEASGKFIIDLGNALGLVLHSSFGQSEAMTNQYIDYQKESEQLGGIGGVMSAATAMVDSVRIGDIRIDSLRLILPDSSSGISGSEQLAGNIGNMVLENFRLLLDYRRQQLWLLEPSTK